MGRRPLASLFNYARTKRAWNLVKGYTELQHEPFVVNHLIYIAGRLACSGNRSFPKHHLKAGNPANTFNINWFFIIQNEETHKIFSIII